MILLKKGVRDGMLLPWEMQEGGHEPRNRTILRSQKRQDNSFFLGASRKKHSLASTLMLALGDPCQTANLQHCKIDLSCFKPQGVW